MSARKQQWFEAMETQAHNQGCVLEKIYHGYVLYSNKKFVEGVFDTLLEVQEALDSEENFR